MASPLHFRSEGHDPDLPLVSSGNIFHRASWRGDVRRDRKNTENEVFISNGFTRDENVGLDSYGRGGHASNRRGNRATRELLGGRKLCLVD